MRAYLDLLNTIITTGTQKTDRTGTGTISSFGLQFRHNMAEGFPLLTTKKIHIKSVVHELLWFLKGDTNIKYLVDNGVNIWNEWPHQKYCKEMGPIPLADFVHAIKTSTVFAKAWGDLGPIYGKQWRKWGPDYNQVDQLANLVKDLKTNPDSRRHIVSAWNVADVPDMSLACCHAMFQCNVRPLHVMARLKSVPTLTNQFRGTDAYGQLLRKEAGAIEFFHERLDAVGVPRNALDLQMYQRSADVFLGVPFNIASYGLLLHILAEITGMLPGDLITAYGDVHIYKNHVDQVKEQLGRYPSKLPTLRFTRKVTSIDDLHFDDFAFDDYHSQPAIKAPVAV